MHFAMLNDDTLLHRCVLVDCALAYDLPPDPPLLARQSVVPIPYHFLLLVPDAITLPHSMHRPVPAFKAEGFLPEANPPILVLRGPLLQLPERMGSRSLWCRERTVAYTRLRRAA